eukprot:1153658-Pelagomonas_calceolata.AAC.1
MAASQGWILATKPLNHKREECMRLRTGRHASNMNTKGNMPGWMASELNLTEQELWRYSH